MKSIILLFLFILSIFTISAQEIEGTYSNEWISDLGEGMQYTLELKEDGNFVFFYKRMYLGDYPDKDIEVKGTWNLRGHLLVLNTDSSEHKDFASNLNANKARFVSVSPRNPNFNQIKPTLEFYKSDVFYLKDMELVKTVSSVSAITNQ